jgi:hypothetical protein
MHYFYGEQIRTLAIPIEPKAQRKTEGEGWDMVEPHGYWHNLGADSSRNLGLPAEREESPASTHHVNKSEL